MFLQFDQDVDKAVKAVVIWVEEVAEVVVEAEVVGDVVAEDMVVAITKAVEIIIPQLQIAIISQMNGEHLHRNSKNRSVRSVKIVTSGEVSKRLGVMCVQE
jgi:hypothetical protein